MEIVDAELLCFHIHGLNSFWLRMIHCLCDLGDVLKTTEEPDGAVLLQESSSAEGKQSMEEMDVASASASSMSMASEVSEDDTMQLSETSGR